MFFFSILWCSQGGDHPLADLANLGYEKDMREKYLNIIICISGYILKPCIEWWCWEFFTVMFCESIWRFGLLMGSLVSTPGWDLPCLNDQAINFS
jgi:hypothetical protein